MEKLASHSGALLVATGILHNVVALLHPKLRCPLIELVTKKGFFGSVPQGEEEGGHERRTSFWFVTTGFCMMIAGQALALFTEATGKAPPRSLGFSLLALGITGGLMLPRSGFWLVVGQGALIAIYGSTNTSLLAKWALPERQSSRGRSVERENFLLMHPKLIVRHKLCVIHFILWNRLERKPYLSLDQCHNQNNNNNNNNTYTQQHANILHLP